MMLHAFDAYTPNGSDRSQFWAFHPSFTHFVVGTNAIHNSHFLLWQLNTLQEVRFYPLHGSVILTEIQKLLLAGCIVANWCVQMSVTCFSDIKVRSGLKLFFWQQRVIPLFATTSLRENQSKKCWFLFSRFSLFSGNTISRRKHKSDKKNNHNVIFLVEI